jgi:hypothetical protein
MSVALRQLPEERHERACELASPRADYVTWFPEAQFRSVADKDIAPTEASIELCRRLSEFSNIGLTYLARLEVHELERKSGIMDRFAGEPIEFACFLAQWKLSHHIKDHLVPDCTRMLGVKLPAFDKPQVGIQFVLEHQEMLALILLPIEMIADDKKHITSFTVESKTINLIKLVDGHVLFRGHRIFNPPASVSLQ